MAVSRWRSRASRWSAWGWRRAQLTACCPWPPLEPWGLLVLAALCLVVVFFAGVGDPAADWVAVVVGLAVLVAGSGVTLRYIRTSAHKHHFDRKGVIYRHWGKAARQAPRQREEELEKSPVHRPG